MKTHKRYDSLVVLVFSFLILCPVVSSLTIINDNPNPEDVVSMTFNETHGGTITSMKIGGEELLSGVSGLWGSINMMTYSGVSSYPDVCYLWSSEDYSVYQYGSSAIVTNSSDYSNYYVTVESDLGLLEWTIPKYYNLLGLRITPTYDSSYLYVPLRKAGSALEFHTVYGDIFEAQDNPWCISSYSETSVVEYYQEAEENDMVIFGPRPLRTAYYGNDTASWLLHYPIQDNYVFHGSADYSEMFFLIYNPIVNFSTIVN